MRHRVTNLDAGRTGSPNPASAPTRGCRRARKSSHASKGLSKTLAGALFRSNAKCARAIWGDLSRSTIVSLREIGDRHSLSVAAGDLLVLGGRLYVTHSGLLRVALRDHCVGINSAVVERLSNPSLGRWVFRATVYKTPGSRGFVGYGDADPSNTSPLVRGAELRMAETRAVNRALRKAYGIGLCSVEELGSFAGLPDSFPASQAANGSHGSNCSSNGQPRLRDQLCLLIRHHNLDPNLVKAYAADFCGTQTLKEASRERVESFIAELAASAIKDRDALVCKLNSYAPPLEAKV